MAATGRRKKSKRCTGCGSQITTEECSGCRMLKEMSDSIKMNPGGSEARKVGCICPVMDNGYGRGKNCIAGQFVIVSGCPVHDRKPIEPIQDVPKPAPDPHKKEHWAVV